MAPKIPMNKLTHNRNFLFLWASVFVSGIGDILYTVGIMVTIFNASGSALQTVGVMVATTLPIFLLGPIAGAIVDRYPRKQVMIWMDLLRVGITAVLYTVAQNPQTSIWVYYALAAALAAASAFYNPARLSIIPTLVTPHQLVRANSTIMGTLQATQAIGFVLGGFLVVRIGFAPLVLLDLLTFLASAILIAGIQRTAVDRQRRLHTTPELPLRQSIREGITYLRQHNLARTLVTMEWLEHIPHGIWTSAFMLIFVTAALNGQPTDWGLQNAAFYTGVLVGAILATAFSAWLSQRPGRIIIANAFAMGLITYVYALSPNNTFAVIISLMFGPLFAFRDVAQNSLLQAKTDPDKLGRVYALREMGWNLVFMLSGLGFAWLADQWPPRLIVVIAGTLYLCVAVYAASSKTLWHSRIEAESVPMGTD
jgi:MFS family permease